MTPNITWKQILTKLIAHQELEPFEVAWAMDQMMEGETPEGILAAFLIGLHVKGETSAELNALAEGMLDKAHPIEITHKAVDIVGTGGDQQNTVNISTMASLVVAGSGIPVIKHGNRASSSMSGSADVLSELGINLDLKIKDVAGALDSAGITFLFAQVFHPSMRYLAPVRRALGVPCAFNYLGPMTNPAKVRSSAIGVSNQAMAQKMAQVFANRGNHALIFRGGDGLDEITITGKSYGFEAVDGGVKPLEIDPTEFGFKLGRLEDLRGGDAKYNAQVVRETLGGHPGPILDAVILNAAAGIVAFHKVDDQPFSQRFEAALEQARESIGSGKATDTLDRWISYSQAQ